MSLTKLSKIVKNPSGLDSLSNYMGEVPEDKWLCVMTRNRDSNCLTESNWRTAIKMLGGESESVRIDRFGHWACGWWESVSVLEGSDAQAIGEKISEKIDSYPVLDEEDFSNLEEEEAQEVWESFSTRERIDWMRENYRNMNFHSLSELIGCAKGKWFCGYASELLS